MVLGNRLIDRMRFGPINMTVNRTRAGINDPLDTGPTRSLKHVHGARRVNVKSLLHVSLYSGDQRCHVYDALNFVLRENCSQAVPVCNVSLDDFNTVGEIGSHQRKIDAILKNNRSISALGKFARHPRAVYAKPAGQQDFHHWFSPDAERVNVQLRT